VAQVMKRKSSISLFQGTFLLCERRWLIDKLAVVSRFTFLDGRRIHTKQANIGQAFSKALACPAKGKTRRSPFLVSLRTITLPQNYVPPFQLRISIFRAPVLRARTTI
jgi:hypothetical protein